MLNDSEQRLRATNPEESYIVQAPAGSGKTEILTQRYLRLLTRVSAPEQIVALTFTRKAASEMRERILMALQRAAQGIPPGSEHQQLTQNYATAALKQDQACNWQLLNNPGSLRIFTIDSLCQRLAQAIPLHEKHVPYAKITEHAQQFYLNAAKACLQHTLHDAQYQPALKKLLHHVDNRQDTLLELLAELLANRDQWMELVLKARAQNREHFEQALAWIEAHEVSRFCQSISKELADELLMLVKQLVHLDAQVGSPFFPLRAWEHFTQLDSALCAALASLLLTSQNTLRKSFDHHVGLKKGSCTDAEYKHLKEASKNLLSKLNETQEFLDALLRVKNLPPPQYELEQWQVLQALFTLLPLLAAHLHLVFTEQNAVDFTAIAQQALHALGEEDNPTELALYLDHQIHHLLIDEFQDTSISQFQLLERLVQGWQPNDGKTLFVVGDPMQSIYRFRSAEVGLFLRAQQQGVGTVRLTPLQLTSNFRSSSTLVNWVNEQFKIIFPPVDDIESGAISFHASTPTQPATPGSFLTACEFADAAAEAAAVLDIIKNEMETFPHDEIALLVRSRTQLREIIPLLRKNHIPFRGVDIDLLTHLPHLSDVWSITQVLLKPANRLVWLELLRSPWCGLALHDIHCIANFDKRKSIYFALSRLQEIAGLSEDGRLRARFIYHVLHNALAVRHQLPLTDWIINTLKALQLDHILSADEQADLEQYWVLLEQHMERGLLADERQFIAELNKLYSQRVSSSRLHIMTIHKSKGLEFDCVILPGLGTKPANRDLPLLRWLKLPSREQDLLLVSPMKAAHQEQCVLYDYLGKLDAQKNVYEQQRLLYVAVTRAKKRLYLTDGSEKAIRGTFRDLLHKQEFTNPSAVLEKKAMDEVAVFPTLLQLPVAYYEQAPVLNVNSTNTQLFTSDYTKARSMGIIAHELLQWICTHHPQQYDEIPWGLAETQLVSLGFTGATLENALHIIKQQINKLFDDPIGQWLIKPHENEQNEYELLAYQNGEIITQIIDRTFCEQGVRWVIDFKTGSMEADAQTQHRKQVDQYAEFLYKKHQEPVRCGLYYLAYSSWVDWDYNPVNEYANMLVK
ncbi:UvrD-helicase domain-containing protein [Legionella septentrionalis]|uniref:UvrD-helicase domain-containing protein n=1 Tax=Legionella septentrionalis TaxID=2498109 RepID=UPI000F8CD71C|nr:UvrD-helicase domain-containing protein [Legionella septentrionalis]RUR10921.1 ATP-dependent DNA helicase [Legionella septentrionalis]